METNPPLTSVPNQQPHQPPRRPFTLPPAPPADLKPIPRWIWITSILGVLLLVGLAIPVVRSFRHQRAEVTAVVERLHSSMARGDDAGIFFHADPHYQQQVGKEKSARLFANVRSQLGAPRSSKLTSTRFSTNPAVGQVITARFATVFDKGSGTETITLHNVNGQYLILGYYVRSKLIPPSQIPADLRSN